MGSYVNTIRSRERQAVKTPFDKALVVPHIGSVAQRETPARHFF